MAGDWIKMRTDLYRDPKVIVIADSLMDPDGQLARYVSQMSQRDMTVTRNVTRNAVVGALVAVWGVVRHQGVRRDDHLDLDGVTDSVVDDIADLPGFGAAMLECGWLQETDLGLRFPKFFEENNSDPKTDAAAKNRERQQRFRERKRNALRNVTVTSESNTEKRESRDKENKQKKVSFDPSKVELPESIDTPKVREAWLAFCQHRRELHKPLTPTSTTRQLNQLAEIGAARAVAAIDHTIAKGWQGIREPDPPRGRDRQQPADSETPTRDLSAMHRAKMAAKAKAEKQGAVA